MDPCVGVRGARAAPGRASYKFHSQGDFTISWEIRAPIAGGGGGGDGGGGIAADSAAM